MKQLILYLSLSFFSVFSALGQGELDSLKSLLKSPVDTVKINALSGIYEYYSMSHPLIALKYADQALAISRKIGHKEKQADFLLNIGTIHIDLGNFKLAKSNFEDALLIAKELKNLQFQARAYGNLGNALAGLEEYEDALKNFEKTLTIFEKLNNKTGLANVYGTLGNLYYQIRADSNYVNLDKAYYNYKKSNEYSVLLKDELGVAVNEMNMGSVLKDKNEFKTALDLFFKAKAVFEKNENVINEAQCLSNIGNCYTAMNKYEKALYFLKTALDKFNSIKAFYGLANIYHDIAEVFIAQKKYSEAITYLQKSIGLSKELDQPSLVSESLKKMCGVYDSINDYKSASFYKNEYVKYILEIQNIETLKHRERLLAEFETKQKELLIEKKEAEINKQRLYMIFLITAIGFVFVILVILINRYKIKQKANKSLEFKNTQILQQNEEISSQRDKIETQKIEITRKHEEVLLQKKDITDSIIYAKRIQTALLPTNEKTTAVLRNGFCLFKPRDIVSGDFYWLEDVDDCSVIIAADCTGHGVPGAFMSIIGMNFLEEIIIRKKILNAAEILNMLRKMIVDALSQSANLSETKDGMDIALCVLNRKTLNMQFAGAYNPVYIVASRQSLVVSQLTELKGDKMPIGYSDKMHLLFTPNEIQLNKGDSVYLFSDGYVDQFGGAEIAKGGKKFRAKQLKELLIAINHESMAKQKEILEKAFEAWRGPLDQIDDLLILGFKA